LPIRGDVAQKITIIIATNCHYFSGLLPYSPLLKAADGDLMYLNALADLSNLLFIAAYWAKDILWLRFLAMLGSLVIIPYYLLQTEPLWTPTMWSCVFASIHATRAWGIMKERRPIAFTGDEQFMYDKTFSGLSPQQFKRLLAIGEWQDLDRGYVLHATGDPSDSLEVVVRGELEARRHGRVLGHARPGDLAGLASVLGGSPELFDTTVTQPARVVRWRVADLQKLAGADESLTSALRKIGAAAIAEKLIRAVQAGQGGEAT
jgi:CRP-like cAMP-binding protein